MIFQSTIDLYHSMKKGIAVLFFMLMSMCCASAQQLMIDNQGHAGLIRDVTFLDQGSTLLSVSEDKTVRLWDVVAGVVKKTYRFEQSAGLNGKIYASALSADERFLFLGGYFDEPGTAGQTIGEIRILDLKNEKLLPAIAAHDNVINDLKCSADGQWLVSASADKTIRIWDISALAQGGQPAAVAYIDGFEDHIHTIAINSARTIIAAGDAAGYVRTWQVANMDQVVPSRSLVHTDQVRQVKFDPSGTYLYSAGDDGKIIKWTANGKFMSVIDELPGAIHAMQLSADGGQMVAMSRAGLVYDLQGETPIAQFDVHSNAVSAITLAPFTSFDKAEGIYVASAGGDDKNILIWDIQSTKVVRNLVGNGRSVFAVAIDEATNHLAIGQSDPTGNLDDIPLEKAFDLEELILNFELGSASDYHRNKKSANGHQLSKASANTVAFGDQTLRTAPDADGTVRSFSFVNDDQAVVVGSTYSLKKFRVNGELLGAFQGHLGEVWAVSEYEKESLLLSGSGDQTVKIWNNLTGENLLTLFVASDNEWVIWTPQGYYEASAGGEKYIGWHINKGRDQLAEFHEVSAFRNFYHRRDVIAQMLALKSFDKVATELGVTAKPVAAPPAVSWLTPVAATSIVKGNRTEVKFSITSKLPITAIKLLADGRPIVSQTDLQLSGQGKPEEISLTLTVPEGSQGTYDFSLLVMDGKTTVESSHRTISFEGTGQNTTTQAASTTSGGQDRAYLTLDPVDDRQAMGNLYMVSIGVSEFENPKYNLNFAKADADAMEAMYSKQEGKMFSSVKTIKLVNENATRAKILETFQALEKYTTIDDFVVIFIASHGMNVDNQFYIVPHDGKAENPRVSCIAWRDFSDLVGNMAAKVVLFIDTCHSGQLGNNIGQKAQSNTEAMRELSGKEYGVVIMAAATGYEYSLEHADWGHGAFTLSILEGIEQGKADLKPDGVIYLRELDYYLAERVRELTGGRQHPTTQKPSSISRLSVARVK